MIKHHQHVADLLHAITLLENKYHELDSHLRETELDAMSGKLGLLVYHMYDLAVLSIALLLEAEGRAAARLIDQVSQPPLHTYN